MPDVDVDFAVAGRERVINYVAEKYGRRNVAQIITFGKMQPKAAIKDAGRVMGLPYGVGRPHRQARPRGAQDHASRSA